MIAPLYIKKILSLYAVDGLESELKAQADDIEKEFELFDWSDIERAIDYYFVRFSQKTNPRYSQIRAILNDFVATGKVERVEPVKDEPKPMPTTSIYSIKNTFDRVVRLMMACGLIRNPNASPDDRIDYGLVLQDGTPVLSAQMWLKWQVDDAKKERPDLFAKFKGTNLMEELAIAIQNRVLSLRVRNFRTNSDLLFDDSGTKKI